LESEDKEPLPGVRSAAMFRLRAPDVLDRFGRAPNDAYETRVFSAAAEVTNLFEELTHVIVLIARALTFPELSAVLKLYVISWVSLSDVLASVLNEVYEIGIAEQDLEFGAILRNRRIVSTAIPQIVRKHAKATRFDEFARLRNDIVHRGKLEEPELLAIRTEFLTGIVARMQTYSDDPATKAAAVAAAREAADVQNRILELISKKQAEYANHLNATRALLHEVAAVLVPHIEARPIAG
jgi:Cthe_2314-like HEPN